MGKSSRTNRRREARQSLPTKTVRRYVPYSNVSKKFRRFAPNYNSSRTATGKGTRYVTKRGLRVIQNRQRRSRSVPNTGNLLRSMSGTVVFDSITPQRNVRKKVRTVCEQRSVREQVLHALKKTGRSGQKTPVWTMLSKKRCK